jgi:hypothetical protein
MNLVPDIATVVQNMERKVNFKVGAIPRLHSLMHSPVFLCTMVSMVFIYSFFTFAEAFSSFRHCVCSAELSSPNSNSGLVCLFQK